MIAFLFAGETTVITNELKKDGDKQFTEQLMQWFGNAIARIMYPPLAYLQRLSERHFGFSLRITVCDIWSSNLFA